MSTGVIVLGTLGFIICLVVMYRTNHGIPGIQKYDSKFRLLDMRFRYDSKDLYYTFERISEGGRKAYRNYLLLDFLFIACFLIVMTAITQKVVTNSYSSFKYWLIGIAVIRAILDVVENTILIVLLNMYSRQNLVLADICSWVTTLKFIALYLWIAGIVFTMVLQKVI